ncbi:hypothetical protein F0L68_20575 [Solihabitans fulvus]|uniref:Uncharacterized protein n=1 Tax=Solihabitans fulvus TaxID=1892852 RepID=A0A5B2XA70_9PSEU|nr:hypothetical protein [Solihabitans fulvus]KAA2260123.1 hypothetical protein F0L68_20575 [Solihabitans fulvus]
MTNGAAGDDEVLADGTWTDDVDRGDIPTTRVIGTIDRPDLVITSTRTMPMTPARALEVVRDLRPAKRR